MWDSLREDVEEMFGGLEVADRSREAREYFSATRAPRDQQQGSEAASDSTQAHSLRAFADTEAQRRWQRIAAFAKQPQTANCRHCGKAIALTFKPGRKREFCDSYCKDAAAYYREKERKTMAKEKVVGQEYEPSWVECAQCGARRPPAELENGRCKDWRVLELKPIASKPGADLTSIVDRCAELARSKGYPVLVDRTPRAPVVKTTSLRSDTDREMEELP